MIYDNKYMLSLGLDEVGRGALAGPVVAGCTAFSVNPAFKYKVHKQNNLNKFVILGDEILITDSKKMTPKQREESARWIYQNASAFGLGTGSVSKINNEGIVKATNFAFRLALLACKIKAQEDIDQVLIDAFYIPRLGNIKRRKQTPIVHGDALVFEIAAASIIAKVYRDDLMKRLAAKNHVYRWEQNKGYGTKTHLDAIKKYGTTKHHRSLYTRNIIRFASSQA